MTHNSDGPADDRPRAHLRRWPIRIRELTLVRRDRLTPHMLRLVLGGPNHEGFESHVSDEHVKLLFPEPWGDTARIPTPDGDKLRWPRPMVTNRDYTVRRYDREAGEVTIDIAVHERGVASDWAQSAQIGSTIWVAGPPRGIDIPETFRWRAYLGDETALPAIARALEELPPETTGVAIIEVADAAEKQKLRAPAGVEIRWVFRGGAPAGTGSLLVDAARQVEIPSGGGAYVWFGGERSSIKALRAWVKAAGLGPGEFDLTGYWRRGTAGNPLGAGEVLHAVKHLLHLPHTDR